MSRGRYIPDRSVATGLGGFMRTDAGLQSAMTKIAEEGKAFAESIAPVGATGEYSASFSVTNESGREDSVGATIVNDVFYAARVEFELSHTLAKTADHLNAKK